VIDESKLANFDAAHDEIKSIIKSTDQSICISSFKPVREVIKPKYGVTYQEAVKRKGVVKVGGDSFYNSPGRNMARYELKSRQKDERKSRLS
jgi:hypothetical protein